MSRDERDEGAATRVGEEAGVFRGKSSVRPARALCFMPSSLPAPVTPQMMESVTQYVTRHPTCAVPRVTYPPGHRAPRTCPKSTSWFKRSQTSLDFVVSRPLCGLTEGRLMDISPLGQ